ncbi:GPI-anchored surface protein, putative [Bodo saltans]|uniref:GPI-anchored surface protein, putative n=1 Tax=Bodo saltans TaxID=75058 RepID=A0A0S4IY65_BODSA|nr:GPI-anchored surface protein, putative [Bodo saltans]|eukprot:CUG12978.1 GPI-anchored surface protein, putative [Bodo saltans]
MDSLMDNLRGYNAREEASMFAPGSQQGIAIVRTISLSVTRANHSTTITPELALSTNSECIPDAMTTVHSRLNKIILSTAAEVVFESTDGEDACTTNSVEKRVMIPTDSLELFCEEIRQLVSSNTTAAIAGTSNLLTTATTTPLSVHHSVVILRDSSEVWELPNVNAADSASEMNVAFKTQQLRLGRYRALYDNAANMSDKTKLLESVLTYERSTLSLQRQQQQLEEKHNNPKAFVVVRLVDRDIRQWEVSRKDQLYMIDKHLVEVKRGVLFMVVSLVPFVILFAYVLYKLRGA